MFQPRGIKRQTTLKQHRDRCSTGGPEEAALRVPLLKVHGFHGGYRGTTKMPQSWILGGFRCPGGLAFGRTLKRKWLGWSMIQRPTLPLFFSAFRVLASAPSYSLMKPPLTSSACCFSNSLCKRRDVSNNNMLKLISIHMREQLSRLGWWSGNGGHPFFGTNC